jgi:hypothetical protein
MWMHIVYDNKCIQGVLKGEKKLSHYTLGKKVLHELNNKITFVDILSVMYNR